MLDLLANDTVSQLKILEASESLLERYWMMYMTLLTVLGSVTRSAQDQRFS